MTPQTHTLLLIIFPRCFYLIIVTSRSSVPNCEHVPNYQKRSNSNIVKALLVLHGQVLTGFKHDRAQEATEGVL